MKRYKVTDKTLPRYRLSKYRYNIVNKELYEEFKKKNPEIPMEWKTFRDIAGAINEEYVQEVTTSREGAILPVQMGKLWCGMFTITRDPKTFQVGPDLNSRYLQFGNIDDLQGKICWDFIHVAYKVKNYPFFSFMGHRDFKAKASKSFSGTPEIFKANHKDKTDDKIKSRTLKQLEYEQLFDGSDDTTGDHASENTQ